MQSFGLSAQSTAKSSRVLSGIPKKIYQGRNHFFKFFLLLKTNKGKHKHIPIQKHIWRATNPEGSKPLASSLCCYKLLDIITANVDLSHAIIKTLLVLQKPGPRLHCCFPLFMFSPSLSTPKYLFNFNFSLCFSFYLKLSFEFSSQLWTDRTCPCLCIQWQDNFMIFSQLTNRLVVSNSMVPWLIDIWSC